MYDAIVVGARVAGAPTAMLLARAGHKVLLVERSDFPSDVLSGLYIRLPGVDCLQRWGVWDRVVATGAPLVERFSFNAGPISLAGTPPPIGRAAASMAPRRRILDPILAEAAVDAGAELRTRFAVQELLWEGDRVVGIRGRTAAGTTVTERARIVIGADGPRSLVARSVQAPMYSTHPSLTCSYQSYWSGVPTDGFELHIAEGQFIVAGKTNDDLTQVTVMWPHSCFDEVRSDIESAFRHALRMHAPELAERVCAGRREERFYGMGDMANFFRQSYGPGWALVGDAGYHKDPITAQGIRDALVGAEMLAEAVHAGLTSETPMAMALQRYQEERDASVMSLYEMTVNLAHLAPPSPEMGELMAALGGNQPQINRFFGVMEGTVPGPDFYSPGNIDAIMAMTSVNLAA